MQLNAKTWKRRLRQQLQQKRQIAEYRRMRHTVTKPKPPGLQPVENVALRSAAKRPWWFHRLRLRSQILSGKFRKLFSRNLPRQKNRVLEGAV